jgi:hypothetical protein
MTTIAIEHVITSPAGDETYGCAHCGRDLTRKAAVIADHDQDYVYCDRECATQSHQEAECESATKRATGEVTGPCPCSSSEHPWHGEEE